MGAGTAWAAALVLAGATPGDAAGAPASGPDQRGGTAAAAGRRLVSTAFVRVGPDGRLTVRLRDGRTVTLRDVTMHAQKYCGVLDMEGQGTSFCGRYRDVTAASAGRAIPVDQPDLAAPNPLPNAR